MFDIAKCDIKERAWWQTHDALVFTEQGVAMLSSVLNSEQAVQVNIAIMRAFVKLREIVATHKELAQKIAELEQKFQMHDAQIVAVFDAIRQLIEPKPVPPKRRIGFPQALGARKA